MKFKYIGIFLGLILMSGCSEQLSEEKESTSDSQLKAEETSSTISETVESESTKPLGPMPSEEEILSLLNDFSISEISVSDSSYLFGPGYVIYVKTENITPLTLEEYNVNAWNIVNSIYTGIDYTDISVVNVYVSTEENATYHSIDIYPETYEYLKSTDFEPEKIHAIADRSSMDDKLRHPDALEEDFDKDGNYKPVDSMTPEEFEEEIQDIIIENQLN